MEMIPKGRLHELDEHNRKKVQVLPQSRLCPMVEQRLNIPQENCRLESNQSLTQSRQNSCSDCESGISALEDAIPQIIKRIHIKDNKQDKEQGSNNTVDHILKELKGINKIQEEISDLRQYLTSVRGSVDEVSCCVDAVLSEIGELYSEVSAAPHSSPISQTHRTRRGSLGRQNAVTSPLKSDTTPLFDWKEYGNIHEGLPSHRRPKQLTVSQITLQSDQQTIQEKALESSTIQMDCAAKQELFCHHQIQDCQSNHSFSSCDCSDTGFICVDPENDRWPSNYQQFNICGGGGWSKGEISCANSEELHVWDYCCTETQSSTPGHSSHTSSEHLSLLFGLHYNSPSYSLSLDKRNKGLQKKEKDLRCVYSVKCPYSQNSGYNNMDAYANAESRGSFMTGSCSTVLLTDCDCGYLEPHSLCDDYPPSDDTLEHGSAESLDRDWTDNSISKDDVGESVSQHSLEISARVGFDVPTFSKAVLSFRSSLKGALKKFDALNPDDLEEDITHVDEAKEVMITTCHTEEVTNNHNPCAPTKDDSEASAYTAWRETIEKQSCSAQALHQEAGDSLSTPNNSSDIETLQSKEEGQTNLEMSGLHLKPHCLLMQDDCPLNALLSSDKASFNSSSENNIVEKFGKPMDANHKARIANFQRILKEKKQTHQRLSQSTQDSQGSCGSQVSQVFRSQEKYNKETVQEEIQVEPVLSAPY
ncbi:uncharacterized protein LOC133414266 [Phycodurus eques]|uniref:uncharacterized protein LOC133414266 n=1 Tax=Phycodurus eques TaxID=693459 RepID=UPI002ACDB4CB|nr:uncharacterized protein LOC133414266 [Phycodurus eques]